MQRTRYVSQGIFLALTLVGVFALRSNAEVWCPFGGVEALGTYVTEGSLTCSLGVSNFYALAGLLVLVLIARRAFCGYVCPIGALTEWFGRLGLRAGIRPHLVPRVLDQALSLLKYGVLALILWLTWQTGELVFRKADPCYALMSRHGEDITFWAYVVSGALLAGALFTSLPFCRWLCPLAALLNPLSRFGFLRIRRDERACSGCGHCETVCPMQIPVHAVAEVREARCISCLSCISDCPTATAGTLSWGPPRRIGRPWPQRALIALLVVVTGSVVAAAYAFPLASFTKARGEPPAVTATLDLRIAGVTCRGSSTLLTWFLFRDDALEINGYVKVEAWPDPTAARVRVTYDPAKTEPATIKDAIITPYFDSFQGFERESPFRIEGYSPWEEAPPARKPDARPR